ncbi:MAG: hypothetical protein Q9225_001341 [Loekoesia sp. 1 TL-2023]
MPFRLLNLPPEIRDQIYHEVLSSDTARRPPVDDDYPASYKFDLGILRANKQIYHEAKKAFQDNVFIKITTPWEESIAHISSEGRVPIITTGPKAENFRSFHLWIFIDAPDQNRLLRPFGLVKDLHSFSVHGAKLLPSVEEALKEEQTIPDPSAEECLEKATALKDAGNASLQAGDYASALQQYTDAFAAIHITVSGRKRYIHADGYYIREVMSGPYTGQRCDYVRLLIRVKLVANFIQTYLKMQDWEEARFWGKRSIILFRASLTGDDDDDLADETKWRWVNASATMEFPARTEMGKILYRTALASRELGLKKEMENLVRAAAVYLPRDEIVQAEKRMLDQRKT